MNEEYINNLLLTIMSKDDCYNDELISLIKSVLTSNCSNNAKQALIEQCVEEYNK